MPIHKRMPPLKPGHLLEIGCASGAFLHAMAQKGWTSGNRIPQKAADAARRLGYAVEVGQ